MGKLVRGLKPKEDVWL